MANGARRNGYTYNRVLIEASRVLDAQFSDAVVFLTGAQLEMLRNVSQYLGRRDTYVSEYKTGYYITASDEDYDSILEIVADMEEALMGNNNTIWGISERWHKVRQDVVTGLDDALVVLDSVPEGELWILEEAYGVHDAVTEKELKLYVYGPNGVFFLDTVLSASPIIRHRWKGRIVLAEGDYCVLWVVAPGDGKVATLSVWGHKMEVPIET